MLQQRFCFLQHITTSGNPRYPPREHPKTAVGAIATDTGDAILCAEARAN